MMVTVRLNFGITVELLVVPHHNEQSMIRCTPVQFTFSSLNASFGFVLAISVSILSPEFVSASLKYLSPYKRDSTVISHVELLGRNNRNHRPCNYLLPLPKANKHRPKKPNPNPHSSTNSCKQAWDINQRLIGFM